MVKVKCKRCNKVFEVKLYRKDTAKFCSHLCYSKDLKGCISKNRLGKYINCKYCKKKFWVQPHQEKNGRKYCSSKCYHDSPSLNIGKKYLKNISKLIIKKGTYQKCKKCGKDFYVYPYQKNRKFCSMECSKTGIYKKCKICNKEFWTRNCLKNKSFYCSKKCSDVGLKTGKCKICKICKKEFYVTKDRINRGWGKYCSLKCVGKDNRKEKNYNWKGGISSLNHLIRCLPKYKEWRLKIYERDYFICQMPECNKIERILHAHHIKPFIEIIFKYNIKTVEDALNCKELWDINNGITLCKKCHYKIEKHEIEYESLFKEIIALK